MLDLIHYYFESDNSYQTEEEAQSKSSVRAALYETLYDRPFNYKYTPKKKSNTASETPEYDTPSTQNFDDIDPDGDIVPFNPRAEKTKAYVEPTEFDPTAALPFGDTLDAPLGG